MRPSARGALACLASNSHASAGLDIPTRCPPPDAHLSSLRGGGELVLGPGGEDLDLLHRDQRRQLGAPMSDLVDVEAVIRRELAALKPPANRVTDDSRGRVVKHDEFTPYQLVAARGLLGWSQARLATEAGV